MLLNIWIDWYLLVLFGFISLYWFVCVWLFVVYFLYFVFMDLMVVWEWFGMFIFGMMLIKCFDVLFKIFWKFVIVKKLELEVVWFLFDLSWGIKYFVLLGLWYCLFLIYVKFYSLICKFIFDIFIKLKNFL